MHLHCYRMLGSYYDAEEATQETLLRAWRRLDTFEGRAPMRHWLYRIATTTCLNFLAARRRPAAAGQLQRIRLRTTRANGGPAIAAYLPDRAGSAEPYGLMALTLTDRDLTDREVATITGFPDPALFPVFALAAPGDDDRMA